MNSRTNSKCNEPHFFYSSFCDCFLCASLNGSAYFFPRYVAMVFVWFHLYIYSSPCGGFYKVALISYVMLIIHAMIFVLLSIEVSAFRRGAVSHHDNPREVYVKLTWSDWTSNLPPEWTIFHPLNARYIPLPDRLYGDDEGNE